MGELYEISLRERIRLNLIAAMEQSGVNQVQLAEKLGISKGTVNNWARGNNSPDVDMVPKICSVLGISILQLYSPTKLEQPEITAETEKSFILYPLEKDHIKKYRSLDPYGQEAVDGVLDVEWRRCEEEKATKLREAQEQASREAAEEIAPVVTLPQPRTQVAAAEGAGAFLLDDGYEEIPVELNKYTQQADVILKVVGRSMEPVIADGDRILVRQQPSVRIGEIGIFIIDGEGFLKESAPDRLVSLNPAISDVIIGDMQSAECYGKFIKVLDPEWVIEK